MNQQQKDMAAQQWLNQAQQMAAEVLQEQDAGWRKLMEKLLEQEAVDGAAVLACLAQATTA